MSKARIPGHSNHHRWFLQNMLNKHAVSKAKIVPLFVRTMLLSEQTIDGFESWPPEEQFKRIHAFIEELNPRLDKVNLTISQVCCEATNVKYYVMHAIADTDVAKAAAHKLMSKVEREFLRMVIKGVVTSPEGHISEIACLNFSNALADCKLSKRDASVLLGSLANQKWLQMVHGQVYLGPRTLTEWQNYLAEEYEDHFDRCKLCKELTLLGEKCPSGCGIKIHALCLETYYGSGASQKCVVCKTPWPFEPRPEIEPDAEAASSSSSDDGE